jgi:hypothetical protein
LDHQILWRRPKAGHHPLQRHPGDILLGTFSAGMCDPNYVSHRIDNIDTQYDFGIIGDQSVNALDFLRRFAIHNGYTVAMDLLRCPQGSGSEALQDGLMVAGYSFQRSFPVRFYIQPGNAKGEPVLDK